MCKHTYIYKYAQLLMGKVLQTLLYGCLFDLGQSWQGTTGNGCEMWADI